MTYTHDAYTNTWLVGNIMEEGYIKHNQNSLKAFVQIQVWTST